MELNRRWRQAKRLDRLVEHDLVAVDREAAFGDDGSDIARRDRAVELAGVAGSADQNERLAVQLGGDRFGVRLVREVIGLELGTAAFEHLLVVFGGAQRLLLRQQIIAGVTVLDVDDVAHLSEAANTLKKNNLHVFLAPSLKREIANSQFGASGGLRADR